MSGFVEVKTSELAGKALDWATFCAIYPDMQPIIKITESTTKLLFKGAAKSATFPRSARLARMGLYGIEIDWCPSGDWDCGGELIERFKVMITYHNGLDRTPLATTDAMHPAFEAGETILIAACRAIIASVLGDTVSVPKELLS